jgi:hypothetical protein
MSPDGVCETNAFRNNDCLATKVHVEAAVNSELAAGLLANEAFEPGFENAQIAELEPEQSGGNEGNDAAG